MMSWMSSYKMSAPLWVSLNWPRSQNLWYFVVADVFDREQHSNFLKEACCWRGIKFKKCSKSNKKCLRKQKMCKRRSLLRPNDLKWEQSIIFCGTLWHWIALYGLELPCMAMYDLVWPYMALCGLTWSCYCFSWPSPHGVSFDFIRIYRLFLRSQI